MKIKDQIRARRDQLGLSVTDLSAKMGVTDQAVRHWESGRSNPSKRLARQLEELMKFQLDWSEGARHSGDDTTINALIDQKDIDLLLVICRLPYDAKHLIGELARMHLAALERGAHTINAKETTRPIPPFLEKSSAKNDGRKTTKSTPPGARKAAS